MLNRGNGRRRVFGTDGDYDAFCRVLALAAARYPVAVLAYCLMPNHWHLLVRPEGDRDLPAFMRWLRGGNGVITDSRNFGGGNGVITDSRNFELFRRRK